MIPRIGQYLRRGALALAAGGMIACFPGGIVDKGGLVYNAGIAPSITMTRGAPYKVVCVDQAEVRRREDLSEADLRVLGPAVNYKPAHEYRGGCEQTGETSVFFLFNMWPTTPPLDPEYAIGTAVQRLEGDTMVNIHYWHELHYYSVLGRVAVMKVRGDVIKFLNDEERKSYERELKTRLREQSKRR
ncbi:MAG: hypothetical protein RIF32_07270 [Leptospirales bacterium]|jgi:hypothetical protein